MNLWADLAVVLMYIRIKMPGKIMNTKIFVGVLVIVALIMAVFAVIRLDTTGESGSGLSQEFFYDIKAIAKIYTNLII